MRCEFTKEGGDRCGANALKGERLCWAHHPDREEERQRARSRGGKSTAAKRRPEPVAADFDGPAEMMALLERVTTDALNGRRSLQELRAVGYAVRTAAKLWEDHEFERRLTELERAIEERERTTW